jgi:hypothetical protein
MVILTRLRLMTLLCGLGLLALAALLGGDQGPTILPAAAQNTICPTAPPGTSDNRCASTAFVQQAVSGTGALPPLLNGDIWIGNNLNTAVGLMMSGDCTLSNAGVIRCAGATGGTVTSVTTGTGLTGGPITTTGTISLAAVSADNLLLNATAGSAAPTGQPIGSCSATASALNYSTGTHAFGCVTDVARLTVADQTLSGGANVTSGNLGTITSGTTTIDCGASPLQYFTNGGASTLAAPVNDGSCMVLTTNNGSAGTLTLSGFTVGSSTGGTLDTTNAHKFTIAIWRINGTSGYSIFAHQ